MVRATSRPWSSDTGFGYREFNHHTTSSLLKALDVDSPVVTYTLTSIPTGGYLSSTDFPGQFLPVNFTFTQADIDMRQGQLRQDYGEQRNRRIPVHRKGW